MQGNHLICTRYNILGQNNSSTPMFVFFVKLTFGLRPALVKCGEALTLRLVASRSGRFLQELHVSFES